MRWLNSTSKWSTTIIVTFFIAWFWTEVAEYGSRNEFTAEVTEFMAAGNRFTIKDGDELRAVMAAMNRRMDHDERRVERLAQQAHEHPMESVASK
jgi:hypothetical protein